MTFVWNNIIKIGKCDDKGTPPDYIYNIEKEYFSVIKEEIKILKPNVIIFLTGPNYDDVLENNFGTLILDKISDLPERELASIKLFKTPYVYRTYHPMGTKFFGKEYAEKCLNSIINNINFNDPTNFNLHSLDSLKEMLKNAEIEKANLLKEQKFEMASVMRDKEQIIKNILD